MRNIIKQWMIGVSKINSEEIDHFVKSRFIRRMIVSYNKIKIHENGNS